MKYSVLAVALMPLFAVPAVRAADDNEKIAEQAVDTIYAKGESFAQKMGTQRITRGQIERTVTGNGTISELLKSNLNVQFSNANGTGAGAGEIAPENVSIHGEKFYNNSWQIDGMSNNDIVNPGADNGRTNTTTPAGNAATDLPGGGTQSFWVNSGVIDRVDVYDSNISAKYGQFTGGVIDARLKDPSTRKASGSVEYRTSRDSWVKYHEDDPDFFTANALNRQPKFKKQIFSLNINQPINDKAAILFSYNRTQSKIPYFHTSWQNWDNQRRLSETYLLKGLYALDSNNKFKLTAMYSPHESEYVRANTKDGHFSNNGGGYRINGEWEHFFDKGNVNTYFGYKHTQNKIKNDKDHFYSWYGSVSAANRNRLINAGVFDWCTTYNASGACISANQGGFGTFETSNSIWTAKQEYSLNPINWGNTLHELGFGWQADFAQSGYKRDKDHYSYSQFTYDTNTVCASGDDACIDGYLYGRRRSNHWARDIKVNNNHYSAYFQDKIDWGRWQVTLGLRAEHERFLKNTNIAPRLTASYSLFGDEHTRIFGGLNRYYSANMLATKLSEARRGTQTEVRTSASGDWTASGAVSTSTSTRYSQPSHLKTPHSDEINLGVEHRLGNSVWTAKWVQRHGKNGLIRKDIDIDGVSYRSLSNDGFSRGNTFSIEGRNMNTWKVHPNMLVNISGGLNYSRNKSNTSTYEDDVDDDYRVIIDGKLLGNNDTPQTEFNTPWRATLSTNVTFPKWWNLRWTNTMNYTAGYTAWDSNSVNCATAGYAPCGTYTGMATEYTKVKYANHFTTDWRFSVDVPTFRKQKLTVDLDIMNVFDRVMKAKGSSSSGSSSNISYLMGRQFWLGARYSW